MWTEPPSLGSGGDFNEQYRCGGLGLRPVTHRSRVRHTHPRDNLGRLSSLSRTPLTWPERNPTVTNT